MRPGTHAAADGSFGRSAGAAMGRGVLLLAVALVIGIVLLSATEDQPPGTDVAAGPSSQDPPGDGVVATPSTSAAVGTTTTLPVRQPAEVKVIVANGSDVKGAAGRANERLKAAKYNALSPTNVVRVNESAVYFTAGFDREAAAIASVLDLPAPLVKPVPTPPPTDLKTANVLVVLGADHAPRFGAAPAGSTTTTAQKGPAGTPTTTAQKGPAGTPTTTTTTTR